MKTIYTTLVIIIIALNTMAQPAFTSADLPNVGDHDSLMVNTAAALTMDLDTLTGNGYNWDFSTLTFLPNFIQVDSFRVKTHPVSVPFTDATIEQYSAGVGGFILNLFSINNDTLFIHRTGSVQQGVALDPPAASIQFPIAFNQTSDLTAPFFTGTTMTGERRTTVNYDGFGSLTLPGNRTFSNVFRVKKVETDTNFVINLTTTFTTYLWYKQGGQVPLLSISYIGDPAGIYTVFASLATNFTPGPTGINSPSLVPEIKLYPNPVSETLNIQWEDLAPVQSTAIYSILGTKILSLSGNVKTITTADLPSGTYFIQLETEKGNITKTFIKR